jgi:hypothetical protein
MDESYPRPQIEKRLLPLLDVALSLLGIMLLVVAVSEPATESGIEGNVLRVQVEPGGRIVAGSVVLASPQATQLDKEALAGLIDQLKEMEDPLVLFYYQRPSLNSGQEVNAKLVMECIRRLGGEGFTVRIVGEEPK